MKIIHLLSRPHSFRERTSIAHVQPLNKKWDYVQQVNELCDALPEGVSPPDRRANYRPITWARHYGAYSAHRRAFKEFEGNFMLICEADCWLTVDTDSFIEMIERAMIFMTDRKVLWLSPCREGSANYCKGSYQEYKYMRAIWGCHCGLFSAKANELAQEAFEKTAWQPIDLWYNLLFKRHRIATTNKSYAVQGGTSYINAQYISLL